MPLSWRLPVHRCLDRVLLRLVLVSGPLLLLVPRRATNASDVGVDPCWLPDVRNLRRCTVCRLSYDPTPEGFCTVGCPGCDPIARRTLARARLALRRWLLRD
jgi:hypothetical protein